MLDQFLTVPSQNMPPRQPLTKANLALLPRVSNLEQYMNSSPLADKHMASNHTAHEQHGNSNGEDEGNNNVDDLDEYMRSLTDEMVINGTRAERSDHVGM
jgi:hypothetical protein